MIYVNAQNVGFQLLKRIIYLNAQNVGAPHSSEMRGL